MTDIPWPDARKPRWARNDFDELRRRIAEGEDDRRRRAEMGLRTRNWTTIKTELL